MSEILFGTGYLPAYRYREQYLSGLFSIGGVGIKEDAKFTLSEQAGREKT